MEFRDDDLAAFAEHGATPLPAATVEGHVEHNGARIWCAAYGSGTPVILLHGGLGHSGNWGFQVPALLETGHRVILIDSRGHGRSTRDAKPYTYELMASDVLAVVDRLEIQNAAFAGWSDGACIALVLASMAPERVSGVFFFACNMDPSGTREIEPSRVLDRCFGRHSADYRALSATPDVFGAFVDAVSAMQKTEPNYTAEDLGRIRVPVAIVQSENDEFIKREHADYLARSIPGAAFILLDGVSHFAPLQRPDRFNAALTAFLAALDDETERDTQRRQ
ncbi:alpha/beta hydrolase [Ensifer sp. SSB1]|jgi:pimeloyl-ACP methyl ester carboxylesterase|uniref:alpha/beta fold hydrolase n=1 Tax=Ensifer sp. SSB1 TaxID=2795385 RepID=UPI001A4CBE30|nr:alpha/beta hydrolase [Ensifer sp. SSB1]MBK5568455.1 alpha/beta hydrolase [Ensifer sp. SSB1]